MPNDVVSRKQNMKYCYNAINITCTVASGRGRGDEFFQSHGDEFNELTREHIVTGSLNLLSNELFRFREDEALSLGNGLRLLWPARLHDIDVWICRWADSPLHVIELVSSTHLRQYFGLEDGDEVLLAVAPENVRSLSANSKFFSTVFWLGRRDWYYRYDRYPQAIKNYTVKLEAAQKLEGNAMTNVAKYGTRAAKKSLRLLRRAPDFIREIDNQDKHPDGQNRFERRPLDHSSEHNLELTQFINILDFAKENDSSYSAKDYEGGYYTFNFKGQRLEGQRNLEERFKDVPFDFTDRTVLDLGCNRGGVLFELSSKIKWGVGADYDPKLINAANKLKSLTENHHLDFYNFDLERYDLDLLKDLIPEMKVDVIFALAICMWLSNWKDILNFCSTVSPRMVFESNGTGRQQEEQEAHIRGLYPSVTLISTNSMDDPRQKNRKLFFCENDA